MRVRCERDRMSPDDVRAGAIGTVEPILVYPFAVEVGEEYDVAGVYVKDGRIWIYVIDLLRRLVTAPIQLFSIVDGTIPASWVASMQEGGRVVFVAPRDASDIYFADRVDKSEDAAVKALQGIIEENESLARQQRAR